jgi:DNA-binding transcriptional ArsR family regulator
MVTYSAEATFSALADPTRRAVLDLLRRGRQPAGQIAQAFPVSRPAISKHLRAVDSWLEQYRTFWNTSLANLKAFVETEYARELEGESLSSSAEPLTGHRKKRKRKNGIR